MLKAEAPAKINLHLAVLDKRPDGFHNLESVFITLDFADTIYFEHIPGKNSLELCMDAAGFDLPVEKNIIFRALSLFRSKTGLDTGLKITAKKRIPAGGGLGGGSSDAASTLLALNKLAGFPLNRDELLELAASLGSDVPFFVHETAAARVSGAGGLIEPLEAPRCFFVLVNPGFPSDTAAAYRLLDEYRCGKPCGKGDSHLFHEMFKGEPREWPFYNDFLPVFPGREKSVYQNIISQLRKHGAEFASLSGAGSTCFGVFKEKAQAEKAAAVLRSEWSFVELSQPKSPPLKTAG